MMWDWQKTTCVGCNYDIYEENHLSIYHVEQDLRVQYEMALTSLFRHSTSGIRNSQRHAHFMTRGSSRGAVVATLNPGIQVIDFALSR